MSSVLLHTQAINHKAIEFYLKRGFEPVYYKSDYYELPRLESHAVQMKLNLNEPTQSRWLGSEEESMVVLKTHNTRRMRKMIVPFLFVVASLFGTMAYSLYHFSSTNLKAPSKP